MRWAGKLGYVQQTELKPGKWDYVAVEVDALGVLENTTEAVGSADSVLPKYRTTTTVSVVSSGIQAPGKVLRYLTLDGVRVEISSIAKNPPRYDLFLGEEYHGPIPV